MLIRTPIGYRGKVGTMHRQALAQKLSQVILLCKIANIFCLNKRKSMKIFNVNNAKSLGRIKWIVYLTANRQTSQDKKGNQRQCPAIFLVQGVYRWPAQTVDAPTKAVPRPSQAPSPCSPPWWCASAACAVCHSTETVTPWWLTPALIVVAFWEPTREGPEEQTDDMHLCFGYKYFLINLSWKISCQNTTCYFRFKSSHPQLISLRKVFEL